MADLSIPIHGKEVRSGLLKKQPFSQRRRRQTAGHVVSCGLLKGFSPNLDTDDVLRRSTYSPSQCLNLAIASLETLPRARSHPRAGVAISLTATCLPEVDGSRKFLAVFCRSVVRSHVYRGGLRTNLLPRNRKSFQGLADLESDQPGLSRRSSQA